MEITFSAVAPLLSDVIASISFILQSIRTPRSLCEAFAKDILAAAKASQVDFPYYRAKKVLWIERIRLDRLSRAARTASLTSLVGIFGGKRSDALFPDGVLIGLWIGLFLITGDDTNWGLQSENDVAQRRVKTIVAFIAYVLISVGVKIWRLNSN